MAVKKKYKIVIDRSKWRTGDKGSNATGKGSICLLNDKGCKCCLGFITQQITKKKIKDLAEPCDCDFSVPLLNTRYPSIFDDVFYYKNTELSDKAIAINDDGSTTIKEKEEALKKLFKDTPISLKFVGKAVPYVTD